MATIRCGNLEFRDLEAILFDKDGTLANSEVFLRNLGQKRSRLIDAQVPGVQEPLLMSFGIENNHMNPDGLLAVGSRYENEIAAAAYVAETGRPWLDALKIVRTAFQETDTYMGRKAEQTPPFKGVRELLQQLSEANLKVGIVSSDTTANVNDFVECYQLTPFLHLQLGAERGLEKPDPALMHLACQSLDVSVGTTLLIGDSQADIRLARAADAAGCIAIAWGSMRPQTLGEADGLIQTFAEIEIDLAH